MRRLWGLLVFGFALVLGVPATALAQTAPAVVISEVQLGGSTDPKEFVVLQNSGGVDVSLDGWLLEYAKPTFDKQFCGDSSWKIHAVQSSASAVKLAGTLPAGSTSQPIVRQLTDNTAGSLRLVQGTTIQDLVAWGDQAPCVSGTLFAIPANDHKLMRVVEPPAPEPVPPAPAPAAPAPVPQCDGIVLAEIFPNPVGIDAGQEFIELHNPTLGTIALQGCTLSVTGSTKIFTFTNQTLQPGEYRAFSDIVTGLTLPNTAGGEVVLAGVTEHAVQYPPLMASGQTWTQIDGAWGLGRATPNVANVLAATIEETSATGDTATPTPCEPGKYRNPETNRCKSYEVASAAAGCDAGRERNPDTGRCRSVTAATAQLATCKEGQERNLATNRCRAVAAATTDPKPCGQGEERNPETKRCRKVAAAPKSAAQAATTGAAKPVNKVHYAALAAVVVGVVGYGIYEYRQDILLFVERLRKRV